MGIIDFILPSRNQQTILADNAEDNATIMTDDLIDTPSTTPTRKIPRALKELQESLTSQMLTPTTNKRSRTRSISPSVDLQSSPSKKMKITSSVPTSNTTTASKALNRALASPPSTPEKSKINKPTLSIANSIRKELAVKKLDFSQESTKPQDSLLTPPTTPAKLNRTIDANIPDDNIKVKLEKSEIKQESHNTIPDEFKPKDLNLKLQTTNLSVTERCQSPESDKENLPPIDEIKLRAPQSIFARAKAIFQRSYNHKAEESLPERQLEAQALKEFLLENIINQQSTSLYVSGPPGTGKTAQLTLTLSKFIDMESANAVQPVEIDGKDYKIGYTYINCMTVNKTSSIFNEIYKKLTNNKVQLKDSKSELLKLLSDEKKSDMNIIVLDELDKLITSDQQVLFELFSWSVLTETRMILIGISNALDMVDRLLPRLKMNGLNPNTLVFLPYSAQQISNIIKSRLKLLNHDSNSEVIPLFHPAAIQLCSKRSASNTGDLRKAFDICRNAIEIVEKELRGLKPISSYDDQNTLNSIKINHIAKICANVFNQNQLNRLTSLNFQQKFIICMLIKAEANNQLRNLTLTSFYQFYAKNGQVDSLIGVLKKGEFLEVLSALESFGVVKITNSFKNYSDSKISSSIIKKDLKIAIKGVNLLETILDDE